MDGRGIVGGDTSKKALQMMGKIERLILIYDANSGGAAALVDLTKKLLRLDGCSLCNITHGILGVKQEWRNCKRELNVPVDYLHRDEIDIIRKCIAKGSRIEDDKRTKL